MKRLFRSFEYLSTYARALAGAFFRLISAGLVLPVLLLSFGAHAQTPDVYPSRGITIIVPFTAAGTTDILVSYTWRIAFQDAGQQFGLASAISTVIFLIVAAVTVLQLRFTRLSADDAKR